MSMGDVLETVGDALEGVVEATATAAKEVDWKTVGKVAGGAVAVAAVGATAYYVGEQVGHTDGAKEGYEKASNEYGPKFEDQEKRFREEARASEDKINEILKNLKA